MFCKYSSKNEKKIRQHIKKNIDEKQYELVQTVEEDCSDCKSLKPKVEALDKFILRLEEKLQCTENYKYEPRTSTWQIQGEYLKNIYKEEIIFNYIRDFDMFDSLADKLVKSKLLVPNVTNANILGEMQQNL